MIGRWQDVGCAAPTQTRNSHLTYVNSGITYKITDNRTHMLTRNQVRAVMLWSTITAVCSLGRERSPMMDPGAKRKRLCRWKRLPCVDGLGAVSGRLANRRAVKESVQTTNGPAFHGVGELRIRSHRKCKMTAAWTRLHCA